MKKIAFATGSRADYGIMRAFLSLLQNDPDTELSILVTGALLDRKYGRQVELIRKDGFDISAEIEIPLDNRDNRGVLYAMASATSGFAEHFADNSYDLLMILGDRYEMLSVATAAAMQRVPILHIHGGEATYGNYDEFIRHAITKMSLYHFTATDEYRRRVIQLGEQPDRVWWLGALGAQNCLSIDMSNVPQSVKELPQKEYFVVLFHPETLTGVSNLDQINELLSAVEQYPQYRFAFIGSNADTGSDIIRDRVHGFVKNNSNAVYFENLHSDGYHALVKNSVCLVGNSSSGIIEAPSLGVYTVNIGDRQKGRVRGNSIIDVECKKELICGAIDTVLEKYKTVEPQNPYYKPDTANEYFKTTKQILGRIDSDIKEPKIFYDIK